MATLVQKQQGKKDVLTKTKIQKKLLHVNSQFTIFFFSRSYHNCYFFMGPSREISCSFTKFHIISREVSTQMY